MSTESLAEEFLIEFEKSVAAQRVPLSCRICGKVVAHVHPPAPPVPLTCSQCREVTP
ncbi:hypothetical protein [Rhodococcoides fascians]|uniref:hypothetical protein n=1 Tax=Rhodococcoides fascians TaxID=1828 RepID=UPI0012D2D3F5|nr:hypothetical protein [Rhodococcus fascians]